MCADEFVFRVEYFVHWRVRFFVGHLNFFFDFLCLYVMRMTSRDKRPSSYLRFARSMEVFLSLGICQRDSPNFLFFFDLLPKVSRSTADVVYMSVEEEKSHAEHNVKRLLSNPSFFFLLQ